MDRRSGLQHAVQHRLVIGEIVGAIEDRQHDLQEKIAAGRLGCVGKIRVIRLHGVTAERSYASISETRGDSVRVRQQDPVPGPKPALVQVRQEEDFVQRVDPVRVQQGLLIRHGAQADVKVCAERDVGGFHLLHFSGQELHRRPAAFEHIDLGDIAPKRLLHLVEHAVEDQDNQRQHRHRHEQFDDRERARAQFADERWI